MTTPDTSAVRAWARSNGYDVADRGRLPAELTDAYLAAQGKDGAAGKAAPKAAPTRKPAAKKAAPARKPAAKKAAPARKPAAKKAATTAAAPKPTPAAPASEPRVPEPAPKPVGEDRRLVALGEQLAALTDRVAALEKSGGSQSNGKTGVKRFRRSR